MTKPLPNSRFVRVETNLQRYVPSGVYYARVRIGGELIKKSLETTSLTVARLRLREFCKDELAKHEDRKRAGTTDEGTLTMRGATDLFLEKQKNLVAARKIKQRSLDHNSELIKSIEKTWPELMTREVTAITAKQCQTWAERFRTTGTQHQNKGAQKARTGISAQRFNGAVRILRRIFQIAVDQDQIYANPVKGIEMLPVRRKNLILPSKSEFRLIVETIRAANARYSPACADMVEFLAYSGCRVGEARRVLFRHIGWERSSLSILGDPDTGTKNWETRSIPMIDALRDLLIAIKAARPKASPNEPVLMVKHCQAAITRACAIVGVARITHHDLRHLFATSCIESGVDIPTVAGWLGHKDRGVLAMQTYGHLRIEHSTEAARKVKF